MNKPVNAKIAKLLKNKGFDEPCNYYYELEYAHLYPENHVHRWDVLRHTKFKNSYQWEKAAAPTIADVVMWLYEKYGIWVSVDMVFGEDQTGFWYCIRESKEDDISIQSDEYGTITEAYEAAIQYCLENLIIEQ